MRPGHPQHIELLSLERLFWSHKRFPVNLIVKEIIVVLCAYVLLRLFVVFIFISDSLTLTLNFSSLEVRKKTSKHLVHENLLIAVQIFTLGNQLFVYRRLSHYEASDLRSVETLKKTKNKISTN